MSAAEVKEKPRAAEPDQSRRPEDTNFKQQRLKAWQPLLTPPWVIGTFVIIGVAFIPLGWGILDASNSVIEYSVRYDNVPQCAAGQTDCWVQVRITEDVPAPVYVYYALTNFYQNHRRYVKSRSDAQLRGTYDDTTSCDPLTSGFDPATNTSKPLYPCGLIANSLFNDSFHVQRFNGVATTDVILNETGIAWSSDVEKKFSEPTASGWRSRVFNPHNISVKDEHFIVWMRTAGLPNFKKLYAKIFAIPGDPSGHAFKKNDTVTIRIDNQYDVSRFDGSKSVVLSTTSWLGGKNPFMGTAYIVVGAVCLLLALVFLVKHLVWPRKLGDLSYLDWGGANSGPAANKPAAAAAPVH